jgi:hypothetical protein
MTLNEFDFLVKSFQACGCEIDRAAGALLKTLTDEELIAIRKERDDWKLNGKPLWREALIEGGRRIIINKYQPHIGSLDAFAQVIRHHNPGVISREESFRLAKKKLGWVQGREEIHEMTDYDS